MPTPVTLHIYDVTTDDFISKVNKYLQPIGTGAFHGAVEVYGLEWSYGYVENGTGVFQCTPMQCSAHHYRESVSMGTTRLSEEQVENLLQQLMHDWPGMDYDLLRHNCCHFCDDLCCRLGVGNIPDWVTNLAAAGATLEDGVYHAVSAGRAAAIIAAAKAGEIDARYNIQGIAQAKARDIIAAVNDLDKTYHVRETAAGIASHTAVGAARAAHEILASASAAEGAQQKVIGGQDERTPRNRSQAPANAFIEDPFLAGADLPATVEWKGGAAAAASDVNRILGKWISTMCLQDRSGRLCT
mmetsp:Transcript_79599/g.200200  ORF Transcript_79599/g.200200 Transcript_79599/m.200200 type:complete len:299 (+) Transcript_79599:83-979(+)